MSRSHVVVVIVLIVAISLSNVCPSSGASLATPRSLKEIFIGRCNEYQDVIQPALFVDRPKNCTELWSLFYEAFANRDGCSVPVARYDNFTAAADHDIDTNNRVMYWSGSVYPFVYEYTADGRRHLTIRDVLSGYVIKNIEAWCGQVDSPGFNTTQCPGWGACWSSQATPTYWQAISKKFAQRVRGKIYVLLNGNSGTAFRNYSTFAQFELPNLEACRTPAISVLLMHSLRQPHDRRESCTNGSMIQLKEAVEKMNIQFTCTEDPPEIQHFQCADDMTAEPCVKMAAMAAASTSAGADSDDSSSTPILNPLHV